MGLYDYFGVAFVLLNLIINIVPVHPINCQNGMRVSLSKYSGLNEEEFDFLKKGLYPLFKQEVQDVQNCSTCGVAVFNRIDSEGDKYISIAIQQARCFESVCNETDPLYNMCSDIYGERLKKISYGAATLRDREIDCKMRCCSVEGECELDPGMVQKPNIGQLDKLRCETGAAFDIKLFNAPQDVQKEIDKLVNETADLFQLRWEPYCKYCRMTKARLAGTLKANEEVGVEYSISIGECGAEPVSSCQSFSSSQCKEEYKSKVASYPQRYTRMGFVDSITVSDMDCSVSCCDSNNIDECSSDGMRHPLLSALLFIALLFCYSF